MPIIEKQESFITRAVRVLIFIIVLAMALFHMWTASYGVYPAYHLSAVHWALIGSFIIITRPLKTKVGKAADIVLLFVNLLVCYHQIVLQESFVQNAGFYSQFDIIVSYLALLVSLVIAGRVVGRVLPIVALVFIGYSLVGRYIPGMFKTVRFTMPRIAPYLYTSYDGLFGQTLTVSAQFIYLFVLFGSLLELTGAGEFFVDISYSLFHKVKGGPAQAAVYSSMLMGTINGSGAANVVTTGTFTIPLMKKTGFDGPFAGAVEAVASSGGQIMPPVMGAVAFLMSEITGIPYIKIAVASLIPAILYYATLSASVFLQSHKIDLPIPESSTIEKPWAILKRGWLYLSPIVALIWLMALGYSAQRSAFYAILLTVVIGFIKQPKEMTPKKIYAALLDSVKGITPIAAACFLAGVVMGVINMTGLGLKISGIIESVSGGNLLIALVLSMLTSLLLGMGLPTSAAYMILAVLVAPAIVRMGGSMMASHLFILYFGALSTITPPVALSTFAAAGIAEANVWETGKKAIMLASTGFVIPFIFVFNNELLLSGTPLSIAGALITALIGCVLLAGALVGWVKVPLSVLGRIILVPASILLFIANPFWINIIGLIVAGTVITFEITYQKNKRGISHV